MGYKSKIVSTAKDFEKILLDFENVECVCLDCKSNIVSTANKEQKKWVFPIGEEKKKKQKSQKSVSEDGTVHSLDKNSLTSKVKVRFELGSWSDGLAATKARLVAGFWNADGGDEIRGT